MLKLFLKYLAISSNITSYFHQYEVGRYQGGENVTIDYVENFPPFSTSTEENSIINTVYNQNDCEVECNVLEECKGYTFFPTGECNLLNDLGNSTGLDIDAISFRKYSHYNYITNHTINGYVHYTQRSHKESLVYLDTNHNGFLDEGEPNMTTDNGEFEFTNLTTGLYLVRQIAPRKCYELYPGEYGVSLSYSGKGYFDYVRYFSPINRIEGGVIGHENKNVSLDFILGNNNTTYLSFYQNYSIVLGMSDDIIINGNGTDLDFHLFGNSSVSGNVSASREGNIFTFLGVLDENNTSFDINVTTPVKFVKIDFFNPDPEDSRPLNIIKITGIGRVYYSPSFAYYVPSRRNNLVFINDCTYYYSCYTFCDFHVNPYYFRTSCKHGCTIFKDTRKCDCSYNSNANYLYDNNFNKTECEIGCNYEMNRYFYPEYEVFDKSSGISEDRMRSYDNINISLRDCSRDSLCHAVTFDEDNIYYNQDSFNHFYRENSYFLVKRSLLGDRDLDYMSTTPTTTLTSTETSTLTSTLTTTVVVTTSTGMSATDIAILVMVIVILLILIPIFIAYRNRGRKNRSVHPRTQTYYNNPTYESQENFDNTYDISDVHYMDISEEN